MLDTMHRPELIIIAGPNGSGKTSVTQKFLHHEWAEGSIYINPDEVAKEKFGDWNSREAIISSANYCAQWREQCIVEKKSFVFETVIFISTSHPSINASRIARRVMEGGHDVPIPKIVSRYNKSIENCKTIAPVVDRLYVYDNSVDGQDARIQFRLSNGELAKMYVETLPEWAQLILPE